MKEEEIRAFAQPTWELYRESILSVPGNTEGDVEGRIVYEHYHERVKNNEFGPVTLFLEEV